MTAAPAATAPARKSRLRRWTLKSARIAAIVYLGAILVLSFLQTWLIFPGAGTQGQADAVVHPGTDQELVRLSTTDGTPIVALFGAAQLPDGSEYPDVAHRPTVLYFYGNGMSLNDCWSEFKMFRQMGMNVLIPEFEGYGMSGGKPSEAGCYATADAAYDYLQTRKDIDPKQIVVAGWSLGAASAIELASRKPVAGLMTFSAFTSMVDMGRQMMPWAPVSLILHHRFDNLSKIGSVKCPILMTHGLNDTLVPHAMAQRLADAAQAPITRVEVEGGHNDLFDSGGDHLKMDISKYLDGIAKKP